MSRLDELINELCPDGVEYKCLSDIGQVKMCKRILKSQTNTDGGIPFYKIGTFGGEANAFISEELFQEYREKYSYPKVGEILISAAGTIGRTVVYDGELAYYQDSNIVWLANDESNILNTFLRYCYELKPWNISSGGTIARLYNDNILKAKVPVPPLEVQREIVHILDSFTLLTAELTAELTARKKQYEFYRDKLLTSNRNIKTVKLGDVCTFVRGPFGGALKKEIFTTEGYAVYEQQHAIYRNLDFRYHIDKNKFSELKRFAVNPGDMIVSCSGTIGKTFVIPKNAPEGVINQALLKLTPNEELNVFYLQYFFENTISKVLNGVARGGAIKNVPSVSELKLIELPLPSLSVQKKLVNVLDNFEAICTDLNIGLPAEIEARQKQYEYYRDKLLSFKELS